jgi:flagellar hook-length control protein FliK
MIQDAQLAKENTMRMADVTGDELGGKVARVDAASNDSGLPGSQNQLAEKTIDFTSVSRHEDTGQDGLKTQTINQIVRKAIIYIRNGQHEAKIDLKPEFLGHVRMQITTENHQVTVKILTEFGFAKEMVENSIHQLKADLQQQGLNVDKLEVVVANDADEHKHSDQNSGQTKNRQHGDGHTNPENQDGEIQKREIAGDSSPENTGKATVDYFA